jgi:hypothetical protein
MYLVVNKVMNKREVANLIDFCYRSCGDKATVILAVAGLGLVVAMVPGLRRVTAAQAAQTLDATFGLGERFVTAVECLGETGGMPRLVVQDAARWSYRLDLRRVRRAPLGRDAWLALVGVAAAFVVWIYASGPAGLHPLKITMENGRRMAAPYGYLVAKVLHFKHTYREYAGLDACMANLMRPALYGAYHEIVNLSRIDELKRICVDMLYGILPIIFIRRIPSGVFAAEEIFTSSI